MTLLCCHTDINTVKLFDDYYDNIHTSTLTDGRCVDFSITVTLTGDCYVDINTVTLIDVDINALLSVARLN